MKCLYLIALLAATLPLGFVPAKMVAGYTPGVVNLSAVCKSVDGKTTFREYTAMLRTSAGVFRGQVYAADGVGSPAHVFSGTPSVVVVDPDGAATVEADGKLTDGSLAHCHMDVTPDTKAADGKRIPGTVGFLVSKPTGEPIFSSPALRNDPRLYITITRLP